MIDCLIGLVGFAIIALIVVAILEYVIARFIPPYNEIAWLVRLLIGLLLLLYALNCLLGLGYGPTFHWRVR